MPAPSARKFCTALALILTASALAQTQPANVSAAIATARRTAFAFADSMPDFIVNRSTIRYRVAGKTEQRLDTVTGTVATEHGVEVYSNIVVNGRPAATLPVGGIWSKGEFSTGLLAVLSPDTDAQFVAAGEERVGTRLANDYSFAIDRDHSKWSLPAVPEDGSHFQTAFDGTLSLDSLSGQVLRIAIRARGLPEKYPSQMIESTIDYDVIRIADTGYVLPVRSELVTCQKNRPVCLRNVSLFRDYRKFSADTSLTFEK